MWSPATGPRVEAFAVAGARARDPVVGGGGGGSGLSPTGQVAPGSAAMEAGRGPRFCSDLTAASPFPVLSTERNRRGGRPRPVPTRRAVALYDYDPRESSPNIDAEVPAGPPRRATAMATATATATPELPRATRGSPAHSETGKVYPSPVTRYCDS